MRVLPASSCPAFYTPPQRAFVDAWYSLTDAWSLDTHRARTLNARLVLKELADVCRWVEAGIISPLHRQEVALEAAEILSRDRLYQNALARDYRLLRQVLTQPNWIGKNASHATALRLAVEDAAGRARAEYPQAVRQELTTALAGQASASEVAGLTNALISDLMAKDFTFGNLHGFFSLFLRSNVGEDGQPRSFSAVFNYLMRWLYLPHTEHEVDLKLSRASKLAGLRNFREWKFDTSLVQREPQNQEEAIFLKPGRTVVFATCKVKARDHRHAAMQAIDLWREAADLLSFDFLRDGAALSSRYRSTRLSRRQRVDIGWVQEDIPNPVERTSEGHLRLFASHVEQSLGQGKLEEDDKRQVLASFRYYRLGREAGSLEATFVTWWIAIESLLRSVKPEQPVQGVADTVADIMTLTYLECLHGDLSATARYLCKDLPAAVSRAVGKDSAADLDSASFAKVVADPALCSAFTADYSEWPLYVSRLTEHSRIISDPKAARVALETHERNVRWQMYRLYRVRNEIVHSAGHTVPLLSLVSHLEYYLKTVTQTVLMLSVTLPHVRRIKELCQRVTIAKTRIYEELKKGSIPPGMFDPLSLI